MTKRFAARTLLALGLGGVALTAAAAKIPAWVRGPDRAYPESKYVIGVGVGSDLDAARTNARAEISKTFQARIQQTMKDTQTEQSSAAGKRRGPALGTQKSELNTTVSTDNLLEGVAIKETWFDKKGKKYYALALLDKVTAQRSLSSQITDLEETINARRNEARRAATPLAKSRALAQALAVSRSRDELAARRRLVDPAGMADLNGNTSTALEQDLNAVIGGLRVAIDAESVKDSRLKDKITEKVTSLGFAVADGAAGALRLKATLAVEPFDRGHPQWKFYQWKGNVQLIDADGKVLGGSTPSGQEGQLIDETARAKTTEAGEDGLAQEAGRQLSQYVFGQ
ncbi:MAG TPA: LPP20 family lipoprotein, partial [Elusimicrobiota bacterium]|nr:LPP20 family lipoprotein [Elusimicrobiota bacterium]